MTQKFKPKSYYEKNPEKICRDLSFLAEPFQSNVTSFLEDMEKVYWMHQSETWRADSRQEDLYNNTNATRVVRSMHQNGLAVDLYFADELKVGMPYPPTWTKEGLKFWKAAARRAKKYHIRNLGEMYPNFGDWDHFEHDEISYQKSLKLRRLFSLGWLFNNKKTT